MGHNPRPDCASAEGQQVRSKTASWTTTRIQSSTTTISLGTTASTEGETDFPYGTTTTIKCSGVTIIKFSWTTTSCTQAGGETHANKA